MLQRKFHLGLLFINGTCNLEKRMKTGKTGHATSVLM